jgi:zinc protease
MQQGFSGSCAPKDLETMLQMLYQYFKAPRKDATAYSALMAQQSGFLVNKNSDPQSVFRDTVSYSWSGYNYRSRPMTKELLSEVNLDDAYRIYQNRFSDASGFTFFFVGNFKPEELKPMVEKYIGSLPSTYKTETWKDVGMKSPTGIFERTVKKGVEPKSSVVMRYSMPFEYTRNNRNEAGALMKYLGIKLRESLREDKSGVYGVGASPNMKHYPRQVLELNIQFGCGPENVDMLVKAAQDVIEDIKKNPCDEKNLTKVKELSLREREQGLKENNFWLQLLSSNYMNNENILDILGYNDWINSLKSDDFKTFASKYLRTENYAKFVLNPEK